MLMLFISKYVAHAKGITLAAQVTTTVCVQPYLLSQVSSIRG